MNGARGQGTIDVMDDRRNPDYLLRYLELIQPRVRERVRELTDGDPPRFKSGSVQGLMDHKTEVDNEDDAPVLDLAVALISWKGRSIPTSASLKGLTAYMAKERISDADLVLGSDKVGKGLLWETQRECKVLLTVTYNADEMSRMRNMSEGVERCFALAMLLQEFIDQACSHDLVSISDDPTIEAFQCQRCGLVQTESA